MAQYKNIDIIPDSTVNRIHLSQGDVGRTLIFYLFENALSWSVPASSTIKCQGTKPSGFGFSVSCTYSGNAVTCVTTEEMTDEYGQIEAELLITSSDESQIFGTSNFILDIEKNPHPSSVTDGTVATAMQIEARMDAIELQMDDVEVAIRDGLHITTTRAQTAYNDANPTGTAISTTSRWFLNGEAQGTILSIAIRFRLAGNATVEIWERNGNTLSRIHTETITSSSNYTLVTKQINVSSVYPMMVSVVSDTTNGIYQLTDTSKNFNAKYTSDKSSDTLSYSALSTYTGLCVLGYVNYIYSHQAKLVTTVSPTGIGDYTTIAEAVNDASDGDTILVYPGTYTEPIEAWGKTIDIIGVDKKTCIITNDTGNYSTPAVEIDSGRIANFTIISTGANPTTTASDTSNYMKDYSIHVDNAHASGKTLIIEDCIIRNNHRTALGMGCYQDNTVIVRNCDIWADKPPADIQAPLWNKRGVLYFHNRAPSDYFSNVTGQKMRFINNTMYCEDIIAVYIGDTCQGVDMDGNGWVNEMEVEFINNMICAKYANGSYKTTSNGIAEPTAFANDSVVSGSGFTQYLKLSTISYGNNVDYFNA